VTASRISRVDGLVFEVAGDGPPLLLHHEGIGDRASWDHQWDALTERFTAIRFDARGFGESADPDAPYALHEDALTVLNAAGFDRAAVMGVSMGGAVLVELALEHSEVVERAVLVSTTPDGFPDSPELDARFEEVDRLVEAGDVDAANEIEVRIWVDGEGRDPAGVDPKLRAAVGAVNRDLLVRQAAFEFEPADVEPLAMTRLGDLAMPLLLVTGVHDVEMGQAARRAIVETTGCKAIQIEDAAHLPHMERPEEFAAAVLPFLEQG
jgi:pimeloyl-ACP methyl ester carboxylesterase